MVPFAGEINTQTGQLQPPGGQALDDDSIIRMDWLNENIIGRIPEKEEMTERAQKMLSVSGVREDFQKADKVEN